MSARGLGGGADAGSSLSGVGPPVCTINPQEFVDTHILSEGKHKNNNNSNTIWGGSALTGEEPAPHSGELNHALSQEDTPHLHGAPTMEETSFVKP